MSDVLVLSVKPKYAERLLNETKTIEIRKVAPRRPVKFALVYSTAPWKKIIGLFEIQRIKRLSMEELMKISETGLSEEELREYLKNHNEAFALYLKLIEKMNQDPKNLPISKFHPPQNFMYLPEDVLNF